MRRPSLLLEEFNLVVASVAGYKYVRGLFVLALRWFLCLLFRTDSINISRFYSVTFSLEGVVLLPCPLSPSTLLPTRTRPGWQRKRFKCYAGNPTGMDAWRQDKLTTISKALGNIDNRASKLVNRINTSPVGTWHSDKRVRANVIWCCNGLRT